MAKDDVVTYFAETDFRGKKTKFGIRAEDRARHFYVIGKTGMGKSTMLENMAIQDIQNGEGIAFIDPHGSTAQKLLSYVPEHRIKDVIYFAPHDLDYPLSFNVMEDVGKDQRHLVANGLMASFKKIWPDVWSARMEYILNNIILALLEWPDSTLLGVNRMLADKDFRNAVVANISDPSVKAFWVDEFAKYTDKFMTEAGAAIQNKIGQFTSNPLIRNIVGQPKASLNIRKIMDEKKIFIINLSKGRMGEINANLIGGMLITKIYLAAMSRASATPAEMRLLPSFYFHVDEFQSFVNDSFKDILSEARKYKLCLTIAHQYIEQMPEEVRDAVFGNVGTTVAFRVGPFDAEVLEKIFGPQFMAVDLVSLGFAQIYLTLMIDGVGSSPFSATTLPPIQEPARSFFPEIQAFSRATYAKPLAEVEAEILKWHEPVIPPRTARALPPAGGPGPGTSFRDDRPTRRPAFFKQGDAPRPPAAPAPRSSSEVGSRAPRGEGDRFRARDQGPVRSGPRDLVRESPLREAPEREAASFAPPAPPIQPPVSRPVPSSAPMSLDMLKNKSQPEEKGKNTLREALALAMKEKEAADKSKAENDKNNKPATPMAGARTSGERVVTPQKETPKPLFDRTLSQKEQAVAESKPGPLVDIPKVELEKMLATDTPRPLL